MSFTHSFGLVYFTFTFLIKKQEEYERGNAPGAERAYKLSWRR